MNLAVIGSRGFNDYELLKSYLSKMDITCIISGGAKGADALAEQYAKEFNIPVKVIPAEWDKYGKSAGMRRNVDIWDNSDLGVAFWDGESKGTKHSFSIIKKQKKSLLVVEYLTGKVYELNYKKEKPDLTDW